MPTPASRYDRTTIALHWLIGSGIVAVWGIETARDALPKGGALREGLKALHAPAGLVLLVLILARLLWRSMGSHIPPEPKMSPFLQAAARWTHRSLYLGMVAVPLLGVAATFARGRPLRLGIAEIASPFGPTGLGRPLAKAIKESHETATDLLLLLVLVHAAAALWHHYALRDDSLRRMLPVRS